MIAMAIVLYLTAVLCILGWKEGGQKEKPR